MSHTAAGRAGRKPASSRRFLEEAASELFLENTYDGTTLEQITRRAGVSRNTFFNYFPAKSDLLWASVDEAIDALPAQFAGVAVGTAPLQAVREVVVAAAEAFGPDRLPLAVTQYEVMGTRSELTTSALTRFLRVAAAVERFLAERWGPQAGIRPRVVAFAVVGALAAAAEGWAAAGTGRGPLHEIVARAVTPVCAGFS